ncbi:hypothetical protein BH23ACT5_BH23ACT5_01360 [soil metagenome]
MVAFGPEVVVHHVEDHAEPMAMAGVYEGMEPFRASVGVVRCVEPNTVIAPAASSGELVDGHHLYGVYSQRHELVETFDCGDEGAVGGECPDMHLVKDSRRQVEARQSEAAATGSTTRLKPCTPLGWLGERGSGRGGPPSRENP